MNKNFSFKYHLPLLVFGLVAPFIFPGLQLSDCNALGHGFVCPDVGHYGRADGYNSLGNIFFFGVGMYASVLFQIAQFAEIGAYTAAHGGDSLIEYTDAQYFRA